MAPPFVPARENAGEPVMGGAVLDFGRVDALPAVAAGVVAVGGAAMLDRTLLSAIWRRPRELALYKTLGLKCRQIGALVAWQVGTVVVAALLADLPLGVAAGRWAWTPSAERLGVVVEPVPLLLVVPATVLVADPPAAVPARLTSTTPPALALRTE